MKLDFIAIDTYTDQAYQSIFSLAETLRLFRQRGKPLPFLNGKRIGIVTCSPENSFSAAFSHSITEAEGGVDLVESQGVAAFPDYLIPVADEQWSLLVLIGFHHAAVAGTARRLDIPVINGGSSLQHPVQVLTDIFSAATKSHATYDKLTFDWRGKSPRLTSTWLEAARVLNLQLLISGKNPPGIPVVTLQPQITVTIEETLTSRNSQIMRGETLVWRTARDAESLSPAADDDVIAMDQALLAWLLAKD